MRDGRIYGWIVAAVVLTACGGGKPGEETGPIAFAPASDSGRELTADGQVYQALNRLTFGAKPGEAAKVRALGVDRWMALELMPNHIDDRAADAFITAHFPNAVGSPEQLASDYPPPEKFKTDTVARREAGKRRRRIGDDLQAAKVARAVMSDRELQEVMVDFWENHFNIYAGKGGPEVYLLADFDRTAIRPYALGHFRDLLEAVAKSPAMLFYLDNWESVADSTEPTLEVRFRNVRRAPRRAHGLNENYGRELLELHTLGVDGGYTQQDVIDVARALTGWSLRGINDADEPGTFIFRPLVHDAGPKTILGHALPAGRGIEDGETVLDIVARHPSTARFIARKLCIRFVSDSPPPALVDRATATFTRTDGDIRQVMWTIVSSPEFFSRSAYRAKVKAPFEVVVSALRALDAAPDSTPRSAQIVASLGEPLYGHQAPNGWPETGESWMNTGAILERINFGLSVAANRVPGASLSNWPAAAQLASAERPQQVDGVISALLNGDASPDTRRVLMSGNHPLLTGPQTATGGGLPQIVGLALGAPEFQRH